MILDFCECFELVDGWVMVTRDKKMATDPSRETVWRRTSGRDDRNRFLVFKRVKRIAAMAQSRYLVPTGCSQTQSPTPHAWSHQANPRHKWSRRLWGIQSTRPSKEDNSDLGPLCQIMSFCKRRWKYTSLCECFQFLMTTINTSQGLNSKLQSLPHP